MLLDVHRVWGYAAIVANFLAGVYTLMAWKWPRFRTRWLWWPTIAAESMMMIQVFLGVLLVSAQHYDPPRFHMFYGFVAFITVGLLLTTGELSSGTPMIRNDATPPATVAFPK